MSIVVGWLWLVGCVVILARTSLFFREGFRLVAIRGGSGKTVCRVGSCCISCQLVMIMFFILKMLSQNLVENIILFRFCFSFGRSSIARVSNLVGAVYASTSFGLYPLCCNLVLNVSRDWLKSAWFELVRRTLFSSPLIIPL